MSISMRRKVGIVAGVALAAGSVVGIAAATPTTSTTDVAFVAMNPAKKVLSAATISANKTKAVAVIGGTTTVPPNATTVKLSVSVKGGAAGALNFYPTGNVGGGSGQYIPLAAGVTNTGTIEENVGMNGDLTFSNASNGTATVTASVIGYSTQVTAGDISPTGGTAGQVLTNTGNGANWQTPSPVYSSQGFAPLTDSFAQMDAVSVPAGTYLVTAHYDAGSSTPGFAVCAIAGPAGGFSQLSNGDIGTSNGRYFGSDSVETVVSTTGGTISLQCESVGLSNIGFQDVLIATQVGGASGSAVINAGRAATHNGSTVR